MKQEEFYNLIPEFKNLGFQIDTENIHGIWLFNNEMFINYLKVGDGKATIDISCPDFRYTRDVYNVDFLLQEVIFATTIYKQILGLYNDLHERLKIINQDLEETRAYDIQELSNN